MKSLLRKWTINSLVILISVFNKEIDKKIESDKIDNYITEREAFEKIARTGR